MSEDTEYKEIKLFNKVISLEKQDRYSEDEYKFHIGAEFEVKLYLGIGVMEVIDYNQSIHDVYFQQENFSLAEKALEKWLLGYFAGFRGTLAALNISLSDLENMLNIKEIIE